MDKDIQAIYESYVEGNELPHPGRPQRIHEFVVLERLLNGLREIVGDNREANLRIDTLNSELGAFERKLKNVDVPIL